MKYTIRVVSSSGLLKDDYVRKFVSYFDSKGFLVDFIEYNNCKVEASSGMIDSKVFDFNIVCYDCSVVDIECTFKDFVKRELGGDSLLNCITSIHRFG